MNFLFNYLEIILVLYTLCSMSFALFFGTSKNYSFSILLNSISYFSAFTIFLLIFNLFIISDNIFLNFNNFNIFFQLSVLSSTFFLILLSKSYYKLNIIKNYEYDFLLSFSLISLIILASSNDFIMIYLAIELQSLSFYVLATFNRNSEFCNEAGIKYFVLGSFASGLLLFGFSLIYLSLGTINFEEINIIIKSKNSIDLTFIGILFVSFAFLFKLGSVPFHFWLCDVYEASLTTTTAFFSVVPKIVLFGLTLKFFYLTFINYNSLWYILLNFSGISSVILASVAGIYQKKTKRLLAYSTIAHTGFIILSISCSSVNGSESLLIYTILYIFMSISSFAILLNFVNNSSFLKYLINWSNINNKVLAILFAITLLSISGIPPFGGFYSKMSVIASLISESFIITSLIAVIFSGISCFYYIRLIKIFFFQKNIQKIWLFSVSKELDICLIVSSSLFSFFLVFPETLILLSSYISL